MHKVLEARFHQSLFLQRVGDLGNVLLSGSGTQGAKTIKVDMETDGTLLFLQVERQGTKVSALIPCTNIVLMVTE